MILILQHIQFTTIPCARFLPTSRYIPPMNVYLLPKRHFSLFLPFFRFGRKVFATIVHMGIYAFSACDYDRGSHNRGVARLRLSPTEKDKMMAYTLALALGISHQNIIGINSWQKCTNFPITKLEKVRFGSFV